MLEKVDILEMEESLKMKNILRLQDKMITPNPTKPDTIYNYFHIKSTIFFYLQANKMQKEIAC